MSFFGGGTDYREWFAEHGGSVLSCTIDKYCWISARKLPPFFDHRSRIVWSEIELVKDNTEIRHPSARACLEFLGVRDVEIHYDGDLPGRSGLGSSSAFTVCMLQALHALKGEHVSKRRLAEEAIEVEQKVLRENVGWQDQIATAFGGLNAIEFESDSFHIEPLPLGSLLKHRLEQHLSLFFVGHARGASELAKSQIDRIEQNKTSLNDMALLARRGARELANGDMMAFGELLHETWRLKRKLSPLISTPEVDEAYGKALEAGAVGGKLLGAGSGGFLLVLRSPAERQAVSAAMNDYLEVPFRLESRGAQLVYFEGD